MTGDPRSSRPKPPVPGDQQQPRPGLTSKMTPRPDHGEESYKGKGLLAGKVALITGGDSGIGRTASQQAKVATMSMLVYSGTKGAIASLTIALSNLLARRASA